MVWLVPVDTRMADLSVGERANGRPRYTGALRAVWSCGGLDTGMADLSVGERAYGRPRDTGALRAVWSVMYVA